MTGFLIADPDELAGTTLEALNAGFLCVISLLSTLRRPFVTSSPLLSSANTAFIPPPAGAGAPAGGGGGATGGGGGGGGGGAPGGARLPADELRYSVTDAPYFRDPHVNIKKIMVTEDGRTFGFHTRPVVWKSTMYCFISSRMAK